MNLKLFFVLAFVSAAAVAGLTAFSGAHGSGAPAGYTGSPGDGHNCTSCHGGSATATSGMISTNIPAAGYKADSTYQITVTLPGAGNKGFEVSPQNAAGTQLGTLIAGTNNHFPSGGGTKYLTHNSRISTNPAVWVFQWKAPVAGTGNVTFYAAYAITISVVKIENITVQENTAQPLTVTASATPSSICNGSNSQLNCNPAGGSGNYTYSWTSSPSGFTSTSKNPIVQPTTNSVYTVVVNDGSASTSAQATVSVQAKPVVSIGGDTIVCDWANIFWLNGTATGYTSLLWSTSGDGTFSYPTQAGTYYYPGTGDKSAGSVSISLAATPVSPCVNSVNVIKQVQFTPCTGIDNPGKVSLQLSIKPNPAQGSVRLSVSGLKDQKINYFVVSIDGKILFSEETSVQAGAFKGTLDVSSYAKGIYFIKVIAGGDVVSGKLLVQ